MLKRFVAPTVVLAGLLLAPLASSLAARPQEQRRPDESRPALENRLANRRDGWGQPVKPPVKGQKSDPAPKRDLSGIWDPGDGGIQALGPAAMPDDGKPEHRPPFSAAGLKALEDRKSTRLNSSHRCISYAVFCLKKKKKQKYTKLKL